MTRSSAMASLLIVLCLLAPSPALSVHTFNWSGIRVASLYESITDADASTLIRLLALTHTDLIFRAYFRGYQRELNTTDYNKLVAQVRAIKAVLPGIKAMGGITCSVVYYPGDHWPNGSQITPDEALRMFWVLPNGDLAKDPSFPWPVLDITKPLARQFVEEYAFKLIDAGVDSLFFDEVNIIPTNAAHYGLKISEAPYIEAWRQIAASTKQYAKSRYGTDLQVTLNSGYMNSFGKPLPEVWPYQDFMTVSISPETIRMGSIQDDWAGLKAEVAKVYGRMLPILAFIDWGPGETPLAIFAALPQAKQILLLKTLQAAAAKQSLLFAYPLHGGAINGSITYLDNNNTYDAIKEGTFDTIVQLTEQTSGPTQTTNPQIRLTRTSSQIILGSLVFVAFAAVAVFLSTSKSRRPRSRAIARLKQGNGTR